MTSPLTVSDIGTREDALAAFERALTTNPHAVAVRLAQLWENAPRELRSRNTATHCEARGIIGVMNDVLHLGRPTDDLVREMFG